MAVSSIRPTHRGRGGGQDRTGRNTYTIAYIVLTDNAYDEWGVIKSDPLLNGLIGSNYTNGLGFTDPKSFCTNLRPDQQADRTTWMVYAEYEPKSHEELGRLTITGHFEKKKKALTGVRSQLVDQYGQSTSGAVIKTGAKIVKYESLYANSFGDPFDPAPEIEVSYPVLSITRLEPELSLPRLMSFRDAINNAPWAGVPTACAKMMSIEFRHEYRFVNKVEKKLWWITYTIGLDPDTWIIQKLDAGYHYYSGTAEGAGKRRDFVDSNNQPRIGLLSNEIADVGTQKGIKLADLTKPEFKYFREYPERSFGALQFPENLNLLDYPPVNF